MTKYLTSVIVYQLSKSLF